MIELANMNIKRALMSYVQYAQSIEEKHEHCEERYF